MMFLPKTFDLNRDLNQSQSCNRQPVECLRESGPTQPMKYSTKSGQYIQNHEWSWPTCISVVYIRKTTREISCRYTRALSAPQCQRGNAADRQKAATWQLQFSQRLAAVRFGTLDRAFNPQGMESIYFPDCSSDIFGADGTHIWSVVNLSCQNT